MSNGDQAHTPAHSDDHRFSNVKPIIPTDAHPLRKRSSHPDSITDRNARFHYIDWNSSAALHPATFSQPKHHSHPMPARVETAERARDDRTQYDLPHSQPTPPPIATLHHSPALSASSLGSSVSSPSPPLTQSSGHYYMNHGPVGPNVNQSYSYTPTSNLSGRYPNESMHPSAHQMPSHFAPSPHGVPEMGHVSTRSIRPSYIPSQSYPSQTPHSIFTDDAATKLSDRVRRKCYNCRTTDTSTWRRSSLTPGKVLCNKCGLFERTHSRPRPEQFPHKRGPMVTPSFKTSRSPPPPSRLPPMSAHMHSLPPHHYSHPSIAPLMSRAEAQGSVGNPSTFPEIRSLLNNAPSPATPPQPLSPQEHHANGNGSLKRAHSPTLHSPRGERRTPPEPYMYKSA